MLSSVYNRRRPLAWMLTLALVTLAASSGASWRCLDGTLCASKCAMHGVPAVGAPAGSVAGPKACTACPGHPSLRVESHGARVKAGGAPSGCVLTLSPKPEVLAQPRPQIQATDADTARSAWAVPVVSAKPVYTVFTVPSTTGLHWKPDSGRAPPFVS